MNAGEALKEISNYISELKIKSDQISPNSPLQKKLYKRFHSLLIWNEIITKIGSNEQLKLYITEATSDISTSYFLSYIGIYKAARLCLRSGIENALRVLVSAQNIDVTLLDTIPKLIQASKDSAQSDEQKIRVDKIYEKYGILCQTAHSVSIDYMSLKIPLETVFANEEKTLKSNLEITDACLKIINEIFYTKFHLELNNIDYRNADIVRDSVETKVKKEVHD